MDNAMIPSLLLALLLLLVGVLALLLLLVKRIRKTELQFASNGPIHLSLKSVKA